MYERNRLYFERFKLVPLMIPPLKEQIEIATGINIETAPINVAIERLNREIDLLREYRTRLVADVVTGKLDVREAAARLPLDEVELALEPEALALDDGSDEEVALEQ